MIFIQFVILKTIIVFYSISPSLFFSFIPIFLFICQAQLRKKENPQQEKKYVINVAFFVLWH